MTTLLNFPHIDQLNSPTLDGRPDENREFNCVPSSICAGLRYLTADNSFEPDQLKDAAYGESLANSGTAASAYVDFCAQHGAKLYPINGTPSELISAAHQHLALGHPVIFTEPDPYCTPYQRDTLGWTHVCVFYKDDPSGTLTAMDPFGQGGHDVTNSDAVWEGLLRYNQIWIMEKEDMTINITDPVVAPYFTAVSDAQWHCKQTGFDVKLGMLNFYRSYGQNAYCGLTYLGLPKSNEIPVQGHPGVVKQEFERAWLVYDPSHTIDNPPGSGDVYPMHLPNA